MNDLYQVDSSVRFDKEITKIVKGFALIFMMILHCYGRDNYDIELDYSYSLINDLFQSDFKICVGIFVFMIGYGYSFSKNKDWKYSLQHIKKLLIPFWTILFIFTFPFCFDRVVDDIKTTIYNLFGLDSSFNYYSWFVYFFIYAMIVMPFISRYINEKAFRNTVIVIFLASVLAIIVHEIPSFLSVFDIVMPKAVDNRLHLALFNCFMMTPIMVLGYLFAHESYYERIKLSNLPKFCAFIVCLAVIVLSFVLKHYTFSVHNPFNLDFFYAPMVIGAIAVFFNKFKCPILRKVFSKIGEVSVYMWFFHALFFTKAVSWFYQPAITLFDDINLVVLWTIILTFFASWMIKYVVDITEKRIS